MCAKKSHNFMSSTKQQHHLTTSTKAFYVHQCKLLKNYSNRGTLNMTCCMITENDKRSRTESKHDKVLFNNRKLTILSKKYSDIWYQTGCNKCMLLGRWCSLKVVHECVHSVSFQPHWSRSQLENICLRLSCWSEAVKWMKQKNYVYQTKSTAT